MRKTTRWDWDVPSLDTDLDDIPAQISALGDQISQTVAHHTSGAYSSRPAPGHADTYYFVDSGSSNLGALYRDNGTSWERINIAGGIAGDLTTAAFGDAPDLGGSGRFADAQHRHGMPGNPVIPHSAAGDPHPQYAMDGDLVTVFPFTIPLFIATGITVGLKKPRYIVTRPCTILLAKAILESGSGVTYRVYVNQASPSSMTTSAAVGHTLVATHDFTNIDLNVDDQVQINIISGGSGAADLSVNIDAVWRLTP